MNSKLRIPLCWKGRLDDAAAVLAAVDPAGEPRLAARVQIEREFVALQSGTAHGTEQMRAVANQALATFEHHGDERGRSRAWSLLASAAWTEGHVADAEDAWRDAADAARRAGDERELVDVLGWLASAAAFGPTPVAPAIARCEAIREQVRASPLALAATLHPLAALYAMAGDDAAARALVAEARAILQDLGGIQSAVSHHEALVELLAGRLADAEALLRAGYDALGAMGDSLLLSTTAAMLAQVVLAQGRPEEAEQLTRVAERAAAAEDIVTQAIWRGVRARCLAGRDRHDEARALAEDGAALMSRTDLLNHRADASVDLAEVLRLGGNAARSYQEMNNALSLYTAKANAVRIGELEARMVNRSSGA